MQVTLPMHWQATASQWAVWAHADFCTHFLFFLHVPLPSDECAAAAHA